MGSVEDIVVDILSSFISRNDCVACEEVLTVFDDALNVRDPPDISSLPLILHNILNSELNKIISQLVVTDKVVGIVLDNMGSPFGGWKLDIRDKEAMRQLCKVYTILTNHNRIPVLVGIQLMLKAMNVLYLLEPSQLIDSNIFRNEMALAQFIVYLVEDMLPIIKSLGTEVLTELVRFASSIESFRALPCLLEIQNSIEPWDSVEEEGHFVIGEHYEFDNFQRSVHEENESKLDFTSKADVELFNERKKCFDSFSDMHRRWGERYQGVSLPENLSALRRDLFLSSTAILKVDAKNMPWLTKLFVERYLQAESATHKQSITISTNQFHQQSVLLQPSTKQLPKSSETDSTEIVQTSYANKLKQSLGLTSPVIDTSLLLKLERRLEAHAPSPVPTSLTTAPAATGSVSLSPLSSPFSFNSPATTFPSSGSSPCRSNPPQTSSIRVRTNRTNGVNVIAAVNALKTTTCDTALNILFPKHLQFFANFILECNNYRFIQTCATYVMKLIKQLTGSGLNSEGSGLNGVPLYKGDSLENLVRKLRLLGRLLAFLLFHHIPFNEAGLRSGISAGNSSTISEDDFIVAAVLPVQEMLMEAVQTGSTCLVVPWVCAFLKVLGAFEVGPTLGGYSVVAAVLYSLQTKHSLFSLSGTDLNSCRLLALVEIQSLWEEFPQALVTAKKALKAQSRDSNFLLPSFYFSGSNCPDNNNYRWTGKLLQLLSSNLYEQLQSLKMCQGRDLKLPQSPPKVDPTSPNTETLQARKQTKRQVIVPVQADALVSGNIAIVTNPAFAVPESMSRSSSISLLSAGRQSPISKVASSNTLMVKKKTSNKATKSSLSAASPVFEPAERRRASSSASKTTPTLTKQARVLPARNLFPDDNKVLLERMEGSFWNQHSNLQSIHSFVFTNTNQSAIAQTKEFMALNLRRVVAEVDQKAQMWCASALNNSEDISEDALLEHWLEYYRDQLLVTGKTMISKMYADVRSKMGTEYSRYPEHARVLKLAVFYTSRHLRQQEGAMQHHLRDYVERKLRELMERKRNVIVLSADTQSNLSKRPLKYATIIIESDNNSALPNGINKNNMEDILSSMVTRGFLCVVQHNTNFSSSELDWTFSPDMANYPMKLLNRIGEASYTLVQVGEHLCTNEFQCSSNVQCTEDGIYVHISRSCRPSLPSTIEQYKMLLFSFAKSISHVFHSRHPSISQEVRGKVGIELTKFLLSTLPILIYLDCLNVLDIEIGPVCISRKLMDNSMETQTSLFVDLAICLVVKYQILPLGSFLPVLIALFRDKTSAFYEHSKGMVAISWLMPQGLLFLLARLVIVSSAAISPSFRTEQFWDGSLVDKVRACEDPLKLLNLMVILVDKCSL